MIVGGDNSRLIAPITTTDVGTVLQSSSHDVGTLCTLDSINKWAKYKPVRYSTVTKLTEEQLKSVNYGLVPTENPEIVSKEGIIYKGEIQLGGEWVYNKPTGGSSSPYRLGDFLNAKNVEEPGYYHLAKASISGLPNDVNITESQIKNKQAPYISFNAKWGDASYEGTGDTSGIEIPLNSFQLIPGSSTDDGNWRVALAVEMPHIDSDSKILRYISSEEPLSSSSSSTDIGKQLININLSDDVLDGLSQLITYDQIPSNGIRCIPFIAYKLDYQPLNAVDHHFTFLDGGRAFTLPANQAVYLNVIGMDYAFKITINSVKIDYLNITAGSYTLTPGSTVTMEKPSAAGSSSCRLTTVFKLEWTSFDGAYPDITRILPGISGAYINNYTQITLEYQDDNGVWHEADANDFKKPSGLYRVTALDSYSGGDPTPIMRMLNNMPTYDGSSTGNVAVGFSLQISIGSSTGTYNSQGCTIRLTE